MSTTVWQSKKQYEHPAPHQAGVFGYVCISGVGVYALKVGASMMSCPQDWASRIHAQEMAQQNVIREAVDYITKSIGLMEESKSAFKSAQIAEARESAQKAKKILEKLI